MNEKLRMLGWLWMRWLGVFIAPNHFLAVASDGRIGQSGGTPDNHCSLSDARHVSASVKVWSSWPLEHIVILLHRTVQCHTGQSSDFWLLRSDFYVALFTTVDSVQSTVGAQGAVAPLAHRIVRWIIAERTSEFPRVACSKGTWPGAPDSVRCAKNQHTQVLCSIFYYVPNWISFLVSVEPCAPEINDI
jgi:hypothetical protein